MINVRLYKSSSKHRTRDSATATEPKDKVKSALFLDVIVGERPAILELLAGKDEALLVGWDTLLVLNLCLHVIDRVRRLDLECDRLPGQRLDKDLHATAQTENQMQRRLFLDVIVGKSSAVLELLAGEDQTLLVGWDALLVLDLRLDVVDRVRRLDLKCDGLASQGLHEDLHTTTEAKHEMQRRLLLDIVIGKSSAILELLAGENETLLIRRDALLVLDLRLDIVNSVGRLNLEGDSLSGQGLDKDLHATTKPEH
jgi:hypothetical protein